jgi:putative SOS response-associated peptidase YedK
MCYHASVSATYEQLERAYDRPFTGSIFPSFTSKSEIVSYHSNGFDFPLLPIITNEKPNALQLFRWGLIPAWVKNFEQATQLRTSTLNARTESISEKISFKLAAQKRRGIIPVTGFFEWKDSTVFGKIPHYIYPKDGGFFSIAVIYENWINLAEEKTYESFSILTCEANDLMASIHSKHRMPVILNKDSMQIWLNSNDTDDCHLNLLKPYPSDSMKAHSISSLIGSRNKPSNVPEVTRFFSYESGDLFA